MTGSTSVKIARVLLVIICELLAITIALTTKEVDPWLAVVTACLFAAFIILIEGLLKEFTLRGFSTATFGLLVGLFCGWLITRVGFTQLFEAIAPEGTAVIIRASMDAAIYTSLGFIGAVLALRSDRDDFAFIIPYVRFREDVASGQPLVLDAEAILDGRVRQVLAAGFLNGRLLIPSFVLDQINVQADSPDSTEQERAQRGLQTLESMREDSNIDVNIHRTPTPESLDQVNQEVVNMARLLGARLLTTDERLAKFAKLQGLPVLNLNDLSNALKPRVEVGERVRLTLVKPGRDEHQTVGYLADGTMVVINNSSERIGQTVDAVIISTLQTANGQLVFGELIGA